MRPGPAAPTWPRVTPRSAGARVGSRRWAPPATTLVLGCPFTVTQGVDDGRQDVFLDPGRQDVTATIGLFGAKVLSAVAFQTGSMRLVFDNGWHLNSRSDPSFEA